MPMPSPIRLSSALGMAALLACAGPDDRAPSSPVAGTYRSGELLLRLEPGGAMRVSDVRDATRWRGLHRVERDVAVFHTFAPAPARPPRCDADARYRLRWSGEALRLDALAEACPARLAAIGGRRWVRVR